MGRDVIKVLVWIVVLTIVAVLVQKGNQSVATIKAGFGSLASIIHSAVNPGS